MSENTTVVTQAPDTPENGEQQPKRNKFEKKSGGGKLKKILKTGIPLLIIGGLLIGALVFIRGNVKEADGQIIEATAYTGALSTYVTGWGSISPVSKAEYGKDIKGEVLEVAVEAGDVVSVGDLLFTIDPSEMKSELLEKKNELAQLEKQLRDLDKNYRDAQNALSDAREALNNCVLTAPFSGMIAEVPESLPKAGDDLSAGTVLGKLVDNTAMKVELYFNRAYLSDVQVGMKANISIPNSMAQVEGVVTAVNDMKKPINGAECFSAEIKVPNNGGLNVDDPATGYVIAGSGNIMPSDGGKLQYWQTKDIIFEGVTAEIKSIDIKQYASVTQGAVLCTVDTRPAADAVDEAEYNMETYQRQMNDDFIQNDIRKSQEKIAELEQICSTSAFYSTIDGQVSAVMIKPGDKLTASETAVLTVSDTSSLVINANIDEADISNVKVGMPVDISYDTNDGQGMATGTISYVSFEAKAGSSDSGSGYSYFPATISLENDGSLLPGMSINYSILAVTKDSCLMVPSQCIVNTDEGPVVYVKDGQDFGYEAVELGEDIVPDGYYAVRVEIGVADAENTEIVSGIEEGTVVYQGTMTDDSGYWY